ncbi:hypothetical protein A6P54_13655 [Bacillus sp. MKU004]|nr:hypothetical protein A6P54_13655 [Bacillus sp. MKU004]
MDQEGKKRLPGPFILCLSGLVKPPPLFRPQANAEEAHKLPAESEAFHGNQLRYTAAHTHFNLPVTKNTKPTSFFK